MGFQFPYSTPVLRVSQRLGIFYVAVLPAELLLQVSASDRLRAKINEKGDGYTLEGTQRLRNDSRLTEIANYINRVDSAFPNSIIVAANYDSETGFDQGEQEYILEEGGEIVTESRVWSVEEVEGGYHRLTIPTPEKLAAVIDGQHRLFSFAKANRDAMQSMDLVCSIYLDLPKALQAQIFATINSTQKKVDKSLTYELFGYNVSEEPESLWTPDKLAVYFARRLATDKESPLRGRIMVAPKNDEALTLIGQDADWRVSTAVVVDGILRLFSSNPKRDANLMRSEVGGRRDSLRSGPKDRSPLREVFIDGNDALIYTLVLNYLKACDEVFWAQASADSFIFRTIGVQAVFDILRKIASRALEGRKISVDFFTGVIGPARSVDFSSEPFRNPSGSGRTLIRRTIEDAIELRKSGSSGHEQPN